MPEMMGPAFQELFGVLSAQNLTPVGPWFCHHHSIVGNQFDFDVSVPIDGVVTASGRVMPGEWPAMKVVHAEMTGGYEGLMDAWAEFDRSCTERGLKVSHELWEVYTKGPESGEPSETWTTDLVRKLESGDA